MNPDLEAVPQQRFTLWQRFVLLVAPPLAAWMLRALMLTCRVEFRGQEHFDRLAREGRLALGGFWHESIALIPCSFRGKRYFTLTSYSFDGELAARLARQFGFGSVRGSSSRGGVNALIKVQQAARETDGIAFTLDGPKGPRREAKAGIAYVSAKTGLPVLTAACVADKAWRLNSWDRFIVPKPGARVVIEYCNPVEPPADDRPESIRAMARAITEELNTTLQKLEAEFQVEAPRS